MKFSKHVSDKRFRVLLWRMGTEYKTIMSSNTNNLYLFKILLHKT